MVRVWRATGHRIAWLRGWARKRSHPLLAAIVVAVVGLALASPAMALSDFTWSGATALGGSAASWSNTTNWVGGSAPSGSVGTLSFPALTASACTSATATDTCYTSNNDVSGITANAISIDDGAHGSPRSAYTITGNGITLGAGGITASPTASDSGFGAAQINLPVTLGADQTWSVTGGMNNQQLALGGGVTGATDALTVDLSSQTFLSFLSGDSEVGAVTVAGVGGGFPGSIGVGEPGLSASLNGTNGHAVSFSGGAGLFADGTASLGALSMSGGQVQVGEGLTQTAQPDGTLSVDGTAGLDSTSDLSLSIDNAGTTPGADFTQLSATGNITLGNSTLNLRQGQNASGMTVSCAVLHPGDVDTLVTSSAGSLSGTFTGIPDGTVIALSPSGGGATAPTVRINYTSTSVTATDVTSGSCGATATSTTTLSSSPASPVTNQTVTLTATVTTSTGTPSGTVEFDNAGIPISGCTTQPVGFNGSTYTATCQTSFTAASSPEALTATFSPTSASVQGSTSSVEDLVIARDSTATALAVSNSTPTTGQSVTYTATVTPGDSGSASPTGSVQFLDAGSPIGSCANQPLSGGQATCTLSYTDPGSHAITASYLGDANFKDSTSSEQTVTVTAPPPPNHTLTVALTGAGSGSVTGSKISCPGTCSASYPQATAVSLTAAPAVGSKFAGWGGACTGTSACNVTMTADQSVTATFTTVGAPTCTLKQLSNRVSTRKPKKHRHRNGAKAHPGTITLQATCDQDVSATLKGTLSEVLPKKRGQLKQRTKSFALATVNTTLKAGLAKVLKAHVPAAGVVALDQGRKESASFILTASSATGTTQAVAKIKHLRV